MPFIEEDLHLTVVVRVPDHLTGHGGAQGGQLHVVGRGGDFGKTNCIWHTVEEQEDAERLSADDPSADVRSKRECGNCCGPAPVYGISGRDQGAVRPTELGH
ncbi:hypothetical protein ACFCYX_24925 [Streptomyces populi]|uniref:hypothetical protein n=1 Tax=Streptomyces populi TaxID=2058924 RepID=UPI0013A6A169